MTTQSHNCRDCNRQLEKLMKKVKKEITKVDKLIQNCNKTNKGPVIHEPNKDEKKQIINTIKQSSTTCCNLLEELKKHRTEVKYLLNAFNKLTKKYEKLKVIRQNQLEKVKEIHYYVKSELSSLIKTESVKKSSNAESNLIKNYNEENDKLEKTFNEIVLQHAALLKECEKEEERQVERAKRIREESKQDKVLFSLVVRCIRKAFIIRANIACKQIKFIDYLHSDDVEEGDNSDCCSCDER